VTASRSRDRALRLQQGTIKAVSHELLNQVASVIKAPPGDQEAARRGPHGLEGQRHFNLKLSQSRANAVRDYLVNLGVERERLEPQGYGETRPVESNATTTAAPRTAASSSSSSTEIRAETGPSRFPRAP
jgi:outer membrane protein OmpA-like peptidoglycan-associated protein